MPQPDIRYEIQDRLKGRTAGDNGPPWRTVYTLPAHWSAEDSERYYEQLRDENPEVPLRLVSISRHTVRSGKGKIRI